MNNLVFISGRITGDPDYVEKFDYAVSQVESVRFFDECGYFVHRRTHTYGYHAVNPCTFTFRGKHLTKYKWSTCMMVCLWHLLHCSTVYMLEDWYESRGARIEYRTAKLLRKQIIYQ